MGKDARGLLSADRVRLVRFLRGKERIGVLLRRAMYRVEHTEGDDSEARLFASRSGDQQQGAG
jgi:hypothetical protein